MERRPAGSTVPPGTYSHLPIGCGDNPHVDFGWSGCRLPGSNSCWSRANLSFDALMRTDRVAGSQRARQLMAVAPRAYVSRVTVNKSVIEFQT